MPLFGRRLFQRNEDDSRENQDQQSTYVIEHTGEKFHSQKLYERVEQVYQLDRWTCECTWKAGLTHKEAHQSEVESRKSLTNTVPTYFNKSIFEIIHHNVKPLEKLAEEVSIILGQGFVIGEPVQFKKRKDTTVVKGTIERIEENDEQRKRISERASAQAKPLSDKQMKNVKYALRLADEDRVISNVQPNELQRSNLVPNREKLKTFIRAFAIRLGNRTDSPWIFYDDKIKEQYQLKDRISSADIEPFQKSMTITLDEILREQERLSRKQAEDQAALLDEKKKSIEDNKKNSLISSQNGHQDEIPIILSDTDDKPKSPKKKVKSTPTTPKKSSQSDHSPTKKSRSSSKQQRSPTKAKKQLTLHDMKFAKNGNSNTSSQLLQKSSSTSVTTYNIAVPYSLLQKLDKTRRDRGLESRGFQRLVLHCARTLNDKQRLRLPDEYRTLIQSKYEELELKRRLSEMTEQEKKTFLQTKHKQKQLEQKSSEDLDLSSSRCLPSPKQISALLAIPSHYVGDLLVICTFFTSCQSLFVSSLTDDLPKPTQQFLRSFKHDFLLQAYMTSSSTQFFHYSNELLQILMRLLFKEDEQRSNSNDETNNNNNEEDERQQPLAQQPTTDEQQDVEMNQAEHMIVGDDIEQVYDVKLADIPLTPFTCQELTRLYLLKEKDENNRAILEKLTNAETKDFLISEQIDLLLLLVNLITTDSEIMSDYFEYLTRTMSETYRERNQLLAERRKAQDEDSKQKKLQLQNGENEKVSSKKLNKTGPLMTPKNSHGIANDENQQSSPSTLPDDHGDIDSGGDDDLKTVIQRRRQMVAMSKELKEKREVEAQKLHYEQKREVAIQKAEQAYQDALLNLQFGFRIKPLGFDRNYSRYWFFKGHAGLFVEKGWIGSDISYTAQELSTSRSSLVINGEKLIPKDEVNQWWAYDSETTIEELMQSLNERGIREHNLLANLKKTMPLLHTEFEQMKKSKTSSEHQSEESLSSTELSNDQQQQQQQQSHDIITSFKNDLEDIETRLRHGSLGGFIISDNLNDWQTKLKQSNERFDLAELLIQLQQTIAEKYASGIFGTHEKRTKSSKNASKKKGSTTKSSASNQQHLQVWMNDCRTCKTYSRLYVLLMVFENSIAWNKSTLGIKCKICRRKHKDEFIMICDQCCQGYHLECLRGYEMENSKNSINDLWYCPACRPQSVSRRRPEKKETKRSKNDYYDADIYDMDVDTTSNLSSHDNNHQDLSDLNSEQSDNHDDGDDPGEDFHEDCRCCICAVETGDDNELIQCIQCRSFFHCQCHEPPLRCAPRSTTWMCNSCRNGINNETNSSSRKTQARKQVKMKKREQKSRVLPQRQNGTRRTARKNYREMDEDEDDYDDDEEAEEEIDYNNESDYEEETRNQRRSKRLRRLSPVSTNDKSEDNYETSRACRRVRIAKSSSSSSSSSSSALSDEEEILANINDEESDIEQEEDHDDNDDQPEPEENGHPKAAALSSQ